MTVQRPVSASLARAFFFIVLLSLLSTGVALITLASSLRDAEAVNIAGSLRMQSYRLGYALQRNDPHLPRLRQEYQKTLEAPLLLRLNRPWVPASVQHGYARLRQSWQQMDTRLRDNDKGWYQQQITGYVAQIDQFVLALQRYAENKMVLVATIALLGFAAILAVAFFTLRYIRDRVVEPLTQLMEASRYIEQGRFDHPPLNTRLDNELGLLGRAFTRMSDELQKLYSSLAGQVAIKTAGLQEANRMLEVLFRCSETLNAGRVDRHSFQQILHIVQQHEQVQALEMEVGQNWRLRAGEPKAEADWQRLPVASQDITFGELRWQGETTRPSLQLMQSVANMLGRGLYVNQAQKQSQQLLLMEERNTIARELHDSLAQVLAYLRIQLTLLKRAVPEENAPAQQIIGDFSRALNDAWRQLRELLATFRLTLQHTALPGALEEMLAPLRNQTSAAIQLSCQLSPLALDAQQQVHLLQIVREAVLNAIKHAAASVIRINAITLAEGSHQITIDDNGCGIASPEEPEGHYGLTIMRERADRLGGVLTIERLAEGGTRVLLRFTQRDAAASPAAS